MRIFNQRAVAVSLVVTALLVLHYRPAAMAETAVLATGEWVPFSSESMPDYGRFTRRVTRVLDKMGVTPSYLFYPWSRCYDAVLKGRVWAAFPYSHTEERATQVWFSDPVSCSRTLFFYYEPEDNDPGVRKMPVSYNQLQDLAEYTIGGVRGYFYEEMFTAAGLTIAYVSKESQSMEKLKRGRIDLMPVNEKVGWHLIHTLFPEEVDAFNTLDRPLSVNPLRLIVSRHYPGAARLLERFNQTLADCIQQGEITVDTCHVE